MSLVIQIARVANRDSRHFSSAVGSLVSWAFRVFAMRTVTGTVTLKGHVRYCTSVSSAPRMWKELCLLGDSRFRQSVFLVTATCRWRWAWSIGGLILTGETEVRGEKHYTASVVDGWMSVEHWRNDTDKGNWSTGRKTLYSIGGRWMNEYGTLVEWYWQGKLKYWEKNIIQGWW